MRSTIHASAPRTTASGPPAAMTPIIPDPCCPLRPGGRADLAFSCRLVITVLPLGLPVAAAVRDRPFAGPARCRGGRRPHAAGTRFGVDADHAHPLRGVDRLVRVIGVAVFRLPAHACPVRSIRRAALQLVAGTT